MNLSGQALKRDNSELEVSNQPQVGRLRRFLESVWKAVRLFFGSQPEIALMPPMHTHTQEILPNITQQRSLNIKLFLSEEEAACMQTDACFEADEDQIIKLIDGTESTITGVLTNTRLICCIRPPSDSQYLARFIFQDEGFWYKAVAEFAGPRNIGAICWPASLTFESNPLDTFYEVE